MPLRRSFAVARPLVAPARSSVWRLSAASCTWGSRVSESSVPPRPNWRAALGLVLLAVAGGCKSTLDNVNIKGIFGPTGRQAQSAVQLADRSAPREGAAEFEAAQALYEKQQYNEARKELKKIAKKYKDKPVEDDSLFMIGECYFQLKQYAWAQDAYDELLNKYLSSPHVEQATRRLFAIARYWLKAPKPASEVELAQFTQDGAETRLDQLTDAKIPYQFPLTPNFFDRSRPVFDTQGRALQALRSVWSKDPTNPLAEEALMLTATHHLRKKDYHEANHYFATIREMYANGKHASEAYVLGSYASLMSYQGSRYDGKQLEEARKLTDSAVRLYPDLPQRPKLLSNLKSIEEKTADRQWEQVQYRMRRREKDSAAVLCESIVKSYPQSSAAEKARELLVTLGPEHAAGIIDPPVTRKPPVVVDEPDDPQPPEKSEEPGKIHLTDGDGERPAFELE